MTIPIGKISPYTAMVSFAAGILVSNFVLNTIIMTRPFSGTPLLVSDYFKGTRIDHLWGIVGGMIWAVGMMLSLWRPDRRGSQYPTAWDKGPPWWPPSGAFSCGVSFATPRAAPAFCSH